MHSFTRKLLTEWRRLGLPFADGTVVVAVSGGADSVSLLLALEDLRRRKKLDLRIIAAHLNHGLRGEESDGDEQFVRELASKLDLEFESARANLPKTGNLEQNARQARYAFLRDVAYQEGAVGILTAHTLNDQAETFLLNLIRGSGPDGLSAMRPVRPIEEAPAAKGQDLEILLIRPLLSWAMREETEDHCRSRNVQFRSDSMNTDQSYSRVRIRSEVIPLLSEFNPKIVEALARTAGLIADGRRTEAAGPDPSAESLLLRDLRGLPQAVLHDTIRGWIGRRRGHLRGLSMKHIEAVGRLASSPKSGKTAELPGRARILRQGGKLIFEEL